MADLIKKYFPFEADCPFSLFLEILFLRDIVQDLKFLSSATLHVESKKGGNFAEIAPKDGWV